MSEPSNKTEVVTIRVVVGWWAAIDRWRRKQPDIPGRSEAVRRLVEEGLKR